MNNPFDYTPDAACEQAFRRLTDRLDAMKKSGRPADINFIREIEAGKMLGVLIGVDNSGVSHTLYAFSGQLGSEGFYHDGFVGPVFDYLQSDGYFKRREADISRRNAEIARFEAGPLASIKSEYERAKRRMDSEIASYKEQCRLSKLQRDTRRKSGNVSDAEHAAMLRQSQFEKAELHRLKKRLNAALEPLASRLNETVVRFEAMKEKRRADSETLQAWLFSNFKVLNARGESRSLSDIFADTPMKIPPSGAGECCAPKLLQAAYLQGLKPVSIAEYWYGKPKEGEVRLHGMHYPACRGKCRPLLGFMLEGLDVEPPLESEVSDSKPLVPEVIYENEWFCVVCKPSGMLSVPGKGVDVSLQQWLADRYGPGTNVKPAHRLDQDTSGLMIATFGERAYKAMQSLFTTRKVKKTYIAELSGDYTSLQLPTQGRITLPLCADWLDRPRQRVDCDNGKEAVTNYVFTAVANGRSRVLFHPLTGRTHQLRVHAASPLGLGMPIVGDRLYGHPSPAASRLLLHAMKIEFTFPLDNRHYTFDSPPPF